MYKFGDILLINDVIEYKSIILPRNTSLNGEIPTNYDFPKDDEIVMINGHLGSFAYSDNFGGFAQIRGFPCINSNLESRFLPSNGEQFPFCKTSVLEERENSEFSCTREEFIFLNQIRENLFQNKRK